MAAVDTTDASKNTLKIENTQKRDALVEIEKKYQKIWAESKVFESNAPTTAEVPFHSVSPADLRAQKPKFFGTIAYPYMNGSLHVGHGFTISKVEFATGYARMRGKRALFPLGFHCTGMAIKACADKLVREIELFGQNFERYDEDEDEDEEDKEEGKEAANAAPAKGAAPASTDVTKFRSKKSKAKSKAGKSKYQFQIMLSQGIPREEIHRFADAYHWVYVFPEAGMRDVTSFGLRVDWRRSFVTTDANPFYDSFVRWQMNKLKQLGKIKFGKRYTVYSPKDGQACLDHDRSDGEGVIVQEYTGVKLRVLEWSEAAQSAVKAALPADAQVYFVAATLRPETMYGQTCCFVGTKINYGVFHVKDNEYLFCSERAARNMAFQGIFPEWGHVSKQLVLKGSDVIGTLVDAPLSVHSNGVRILPMETVKEAKGTGVVTCVPSDSPDDYATTVELAKKPEYYGIKKEWVDLQILPIIETPAYGNLIAQTLVEKMKIASPKDPKLAEAKDIAYKEGFYNGVMVHGEFKGQPVQEAKALVRQKLIDAGSAFAYAEPDGLVISRSKDVCVAALLDQWYLNYGTAENGGDGEWCNKVLGHLNSGALNTYSVEAKRQFESTLGWLSQWACARSYGLGSKLPWDHNFLVESLSDSTIYMSYYTVAHYLHSDIYGKEPGLGNVTAEQMTDDVWDYIFTRADNVESSIPQATLEAMRREFEYWYPLDLRVSGKDLIQNHLTFFLYIHIALFPPEYWPRGIRPNGHLMLNGEKMSKSTGNFLTLRETVEKFGADAARIAIADAGDGIEDANFEEAVANKTILKLYELRKWIEDMINDAILASSGEEYAKTANSRVSDTVQRTGEIGFWDKLFENELNRLVAEAKAAYDDDLFRAALQSGFYGLTLARDFYRDATKSAGVGMHKDLVRRYTELQALLLAPVAPHWSEYIWREVLRHDGSIHNALWPQTPAPDAGLLATLDYVQTTMSAMTTAAGAQQKRAAKGKNVEFDPKRPFKATVYFTQSFPAWQDTCVRLVTEALEELGLVDMKAIGKKMDKKESKRAMPFVQELKKRLDAGEGRDAVLGSRQLPFDERAVLRELNPVLAQALPRCEGVETVEVLPATGGEADAREGVAVTTGERRAELPPQAAGAIPGVPTFNFENVA